MAMGFFVDVLEVESVSERKGKTNAPVFYARLKLAGGSLTLKVKDGVKILPGFSGKASGSCNPTVLKRFFNGVPSDVSCLLPVEIDTWDQGSEVKKVGLGAMESFLNKK